MKLASAVCLLVPLLIFPPDDDAISVQQVASGLLVFNKSSTTIYYSIFRQAALDTLVWSPCQRPTTCPRIHPGNATLVRPEDIRQYVEGESLVLFWWHLTQRDSAHYEVSDLASTVINP